MSLFTIAQRDMPEGLTPGEIHAYRTGWDRAARKWVRDHGPAHERVTDTTDLYAATRDHFEAREPYAHAAGMRALTRYRKARIVTTHTQENAA